MSASRRVALNYQRCVCHTPHARARTPLDDPLADRNLRGLGVSALTQGAIGANAIRDSTALNRNRNPRSERMLKAHGSNRPFAQRCTFRYVDYTPSRLLISAVRSRVRYLSAAFWMAMRPGLVAWNSAISVVIAPPTTLRGFTVRRGTVATRL
jgi:hypothetical protein